MGGQRFKIGCHKIGALHDLGQNRIRGGGGVQKSLKKWDIIYARSLGIHTLGITTQNQTNVQNCILWCNF